MLNLREQEPVWLPEGVSPADGRVSLTFLRHFNGCRRAAYLYAVHRGAASDAMERGSALHAAIERCVQAIVEQGEGGVPPEVAKAIADEVLVEFDVPVEEHDYLRMCIFRWADEWRLDPERLCALETLLELDVGGLVVRCKVDYAELAEDGSRLMVRDWKSSRSMPSQDEVASKRSDGSFSAKNMQLIVYALALVFGVPVRREIDLATGEVVERREPFPLAPRAQYVDVAFVYPGIEEKKGPRAGLMAMRQASLTPVEMHEYMTSLAALGERVRSAVETGDWRARPSSSACGECPAPLLCPIPPELRVYQDSDSAFGVAGYVNTPEDASARAELIDRAKATVAAWEKELKAWSKANGGVSIPFGDDLEFAWAPVSSEEIRDRDGMFAAVEAAVMYGEEFDRGRYVKAKTGVRWTRRVRDADEGKG